MTNQKFAINLNHEFVSVAEEQDRNYWADRLGVSSEVLKSAIRASKSMELQNVKNYLLNKGIS